MCEHKRLCCTNCVMYCRDCGAKVEPPKEKAEDKPAKKKGAKK